MKTTIAKLSSLLKDNNPTPGFQIAESALTKSVQVQNIQVPHQYMYKRLHTCFLESNNLSIIDLRPLFPFVYHNN